MKTECTVHCTDHTPSWFVGHWRDWHRGHGCNKDDGKPRSNAGITEIEQHAIKDPRPTSPGGNA